MYSTRTATINNEEFNSFYMPVGINNRVHLKEVNVNKTTNGRDFLEITFENEDGQTATMTEWKNELNTWIKNADDLQKRDDQQFGRILQIIDAVKGGHPEFEGSSFVEMINWVKLTIGDTPNNTLLRLKVIYDKNGYTKVSNLGVFVEPMHVDEEKSQIKLFKNDLLERPVKADEEKPIDPLVEAAKEAQLLNTPVTETNTGDDNLPF